jgi:protein-S-isoprenylcysteine O-methyltransferase Ste14
MPMREEFVKQGNRLFARRSLFPFLALPLLTLAFRNYTSPTGGHTSDLPWEVFCLTVSSLGLLLRVLVAGYVPSRTSGRNTRKGQVAHTINDTGMYSVVRHPLYIANFLIALGWLMFFRQWWFVTVMTLLFWMYYERIMFAEEEYLREKFGKTYLTWAGKTPCIIPNFKKWVAPALPFSLRTAVKREYQTVASTVLVFVAFEVISDLIVLGMLDTDPFWTPCLVLVVCFWFVIRIVRRNTRFFSVPGR